MKWGWIVVAVLAPACASTGSVPRPFPGASSAAPAAPGGGAAVDGYALVGTALSLRGAPYRNGGSDPAGFDCSGFTQYVFGQYGIALPREVRDQFREGASVKARELAPGDLVFFSTTERGASHVAIVVGGDEFVHAPSAAGVVRVERLRSKYWSRRYVGARRIR